MSKLFTSAQQESRNCLPIDKLPRACSQLGRRF